MSDLIIGIVGPCGAGKSTLASSLADHGYRAKHIAQEHSYVPDMWKQLSKPDYLVYLDVSYAKTIIRRKLSWTLEEYRIQVERLEHARDHSDFFINTDHLSPPEVLATVIEFVRNSP
jgi:adenylate kinase family enzyme